MTSKIDIWNMGLDYCGETLSIEDPDEDSTAAEVAKRHWDKVLRLALEARPWPWAMRERELTEISDQEETTAYADVGDVAKQRIPFSFAYLNTGQIEVVRISASGGETTLDAGDDYSITEADPEEGTGAEVVLVTALAGGQSIRITVSTSRVGWVFIYGLPADCITPRAIIFGGTRVTLQTPTNRVPHEVMANDAGDGRILCCDMASGDIDALQYTALVTSPGTFSAHFIELLAWRMAFVFAHALRKDKEQGKYCMQQYNLALTLAGAFERNIGHDVTPDSSSVLERG